MNFWGIYDYKTTVRNKNWGIMKPLNELLEIAKRYSERSDFKLLKDMSDAVIDLITQLQDAQREIKSYDDSGRKQWHSERMQQLEQRLAEAEKVVEFYANENSWFRLKKYLRMDIIDPSDVDDSLLDEGKAIGGIKAREYLAKYRGDV